ncbi:hypothetical protein F2Q68_00034265 [Brassica cretica]|uniref:glucan endo-1,3-beta-D-glucosidase n=1 Tax=Brassica cretica TaxID=69181 RepID=A0A8S9GYY3_BRACR|nr:hypothetical protein F2Q68_00034265 [Brassica cretica]
MLDFLRETGSRLMINVYPFFAYEGNSDVIPLDYALLKENPGMVDSGNGLRYFNLFDAQIDAVFAAMSALKYDDIEIIVTETGWPSKGDENEIGASVANAASYNGNLIRRILTGGGTPLRPKADLTIYLFALFNENKKFGPTSERNYGLFFPDEKKVYDIPFTQEGLKHYRDGGHNTPATGNQQVTPPNNGGGVSKSLTGSTWCVANGDAGKDRLQGGLDYACGDGGADCRPIQRGAPCYSPDTLEAHASFAFNSYYQKKGRAGGSCYFGGAAYVVSQPPSAFLTSDTASELGKPDRSRCQFVDPRSRCQFVDPRLETMSGLKPRGGSSSSLQVIASSNGTTKPAGRGPESGGLGLTWIYHQGRVSHMDVAAPGESDRGPGHGDSD